MNKLEQFHKEVGKLISENVWDSDLPQIIVDTSLKIELQKRALRGRGSVRLMNMLFDTDSERVETRQRLLNVNLP